MLAPSFIYGTAWKKESTEACVALALSCGFRAIDTANQPKHYHEPGVGEVLTKYFASGNARESIFIQTKFTPVDGQDSRLPYDPKAPIDEQVEQSFRSSCQHLNVTYLDSYLLHGPYHYPNLGEEDFIVWKKLEKLWDDGLVKQIGISNVNELQLRQLAEKSRVRPHVVQNRCYASQGWDAPVRGFCRENNIIYQGFSLLTANPEVVSSTRVCKIAEKQGVTPAQVIFSFCQQIGILPLTGTTSAAHMREDLGALSLALEPGEVSLLESL